MNLLNLDDALFASYAFYAALLTLKLLIMSLLTGFLRVKNKAFINPEDSARFKTKPTMNNPQVERVRRAHLNDLENIPAFWVLGYLYVLTHPSSSCAFLCFRIFAAARIAHTIAYLLEIFPVRAVCFATSLLVNAYMGINVLLYFL